MKLLKGAKFNKFISDNRERTLRFLSSRYSKDELSLADMEDVYQESSLALWNNIETGKLQELSSSLYTYFLKICINQSEKTKRQRKTTSLRIIDSDVNNDWKTTGFLQPNKFSEKKINEIIYLRSEPITPEIPKSPEEVLEIEEMRQLVKEALNKMPARCLSLLEKYYYEELSWSKIAEDIGIKGGADSAKSQASRCRAGFREKNQELKKLYLKNRNLVKQ